MEKSTDSWVESEEVQRRLDRGPYHLITHELRTKLIQMVFERSQSVYMAAKELQINYSTAKIIVRNFRNKGRLFERKAERKRREKKENNKPLPQPLPLPKVEAIKPEDAEDRCKKAQNTVQYNFPQFLAPWYSYNPLSYTPCWGPGYQTQMFTSYQAWPPMQ